MTPRRPTAVAADENTAHRYRRDRRGAAVPLAVAAAVGGGRRCAQPAAGRSRAVRAQRWDPADGWWAMQRIRGEFNWRAIER